MFILGACGIIYEYVLGALANHLMGSTYEQIFIIIGIMMFMMGLAAQVQRKFFNKLIDSFLLIEILLGIFGGLSASAIYYLYIVSEHYLLLMYLTVALIGFFIGLEIPLLMRINERYMVSLRVNISELLSMDYIGSLAGALLFVYVLFAWISLTKISLVLGLVNLSIAIITCIVSWKTTYHKVKLLTFGLLGIGILIIGIFYADDWNKFTEQKYYRLPIVYTAQTKYQHITITEDKNEVIYFYINGNLQFSSIDEYIYHELLVHIPAQLVENPKRILILGGGDGLAAREALKYTSVKEVQLVDIDPDIINLAKNNDILSNLNNHSLSDARIHSTIPKIKDEGYKIDVKKQSERPSQFNNTTEYSIAKIDVFTIDADKFLDSVPKEKFDVIIIDFPDPNMIELAKLYSIEMLEKLHDFLSPNGFMSIQSSSPYFQKKTFLCIGKTLIAAGFNVLPYRELVPSFGGEWGFYLCWHNFMESKQILSIFKQRDEITVPTRYLNTNILSSVFSFGKNRLNTSKGIEINSRLHPVLPSYYEENFLEYPDIKDFKYSPLKEKID